MHEGLNLTGLTLVIMGGLLCGLFFAKIKQPAILGYIFAGIAMGPSGLGFIQSRTQVDSLAELGVLLLLFVIGMELNIKSFKKYCIISLSAVAGQIGLSLLITLSLSSIFGWSSGIAVLFGFVMAMSSTAVAVKMLETIDEGRHDTGQITIGILIAQDLALVPMILIMRNFDSDWFNAALIVKVLLSIGVLVAIILYLSQKHRVKLPLTSMISGEKDLTPIFSLAFCFAAATISGVIGLSAAYGAFLAGLVLGNTHERTVLMENTKPIQSTLLMAFFLSIGLLFDLKFIWTHLWAVLILLAILTLGKTIMNIIICSFLRISWSQSFLISVVLAQIGEFAFLLTTIGLEERIITAQNKSMIIALTVLSLTCSPVWLAIARRLRMLSHSRNLSLAGVLFWLYGGQAYYWRRKFYQFMHTKIKEKPLALTDQRKTRHHHETGKPHEHHKAHV